jgi:hypothetical protein
MSAEEEREQRRGWRENGEPLDDKMISLLVSKVKRSRWRNFADVVTSQHSQSKRESVQNCTVKVQSSVTLQSPDANVLLRRGSSTVENPASRRELMARRDSCGNRVRTIYGCGDPKPSVVISPGDGPIVTRSNHTAVTFSQIRAR